MADLILKTKILEMLPYLEDRLGGFPKEQRYGLTIRIRDAGYDLLELSGDVANGYFNTTTLKNLDRRKNAMLTYLDYALKRKLLSPHQHQVWGKYLVEIGRIIGGLMKAFSARNKGMD